MKFGTRGFSSSLISNMISEYVNLPNFLLNAAILDVKKISSPIENDIRTFLEDNFIKFYVGLTEKSKKQ